MTAFAEKGMDGFTITTYMQTRDGRNVFCRRLPGQTQDKKREDDEKEQEYRKDTKKTSSFDRCICPRRIKGQRIFPWPLFSSE